MSKLSMEVNRKPLGASNKRPVVITSTNLKKILDVFNSENAKNESEEDRQYKNYLKQGSDEVVAKWGGSYKGNREQKQLDKKQEVMDKLNKEKEEYLEVVKKDELLRKEKIAKAQELIEKLKPGPKELQSAALQSETLKGRTVQRNINKEFEQTLKTKSAEEALQLERQAMPWIEEEQRRISNKIHNNNQYKAELLNIINEKSQQKAERAKFELNQNKIAQNISDKEIKAQIEKEQEILKRKREVLRKNALEAMLMVEQRKAREQIQDRIESQIISIYNEGKQKIEQIKENRQAQARQDQVVRNAINAQKMIAQQDVNNETNSNTIRKDINTIQLQFTAQEKERVERSRQLKRERIQEYFRELNLKKEREQQRNEEAKLALENRLENEKINATFEQKQKEEKLKKYQQVRKVINEQIEQRKQIENEEKKLDRELANVSFQKDDQFFFDYANKLMSDAVKKDRPILPFVKAINKYKEENRIDLEPKLPTHLVSHLRIGVKTPPESIHEKSVDSPRKYGLEELKALNPMRKKTN